jgi:hypothetical protein
MSSMCGIAERVRIAEDFLSRTMYLNEGSTWSAGAPPAPERGSAFRGLRRAKRVRTLGAPAALRHAKPPFTQQSNEDWPQRDSDSALAKHGRDTIQPFSAGNG